MKKSNLTVKDRSVSKITNFSIPVAHAAYESYEAIKDQYKNLNDSDKSATNNAVKGAIIGTGAGIGAGAIATGVHGIRNAEKVDKLAKVYEEGKKALEKDFKNLRGKMPSANQAKPYLKRIAQVKTAIGAVHKIPKYAIGGLAAGATIGMLKSNKTNKNRGQYGNDQ